MEDKIEVIVTGKIVGMDYPNRKMLVKDQHGITYEVRWREKPEVVDDLCRKQKTGYRVKVTTIKNPNEENAQFWIMNVQYDDSYKQRKPQSAEEQKLILLQSCLRTGAQVWCEVLNTYAPEIYFGQDVPADDKEVGRIFNASMDAIITRAIQDANRLLAEAKPNA